jgi:hypothetical protein
VPDDKLAAALAEILPQVGFMIKRVEQEANQPTPPGPPCWFVDFIDNCERMNQRYRNRE